MNKPATIYLVDDHKIVLDGLKLLIDDGANFRVVGTAVDSDTAYREIVTKRPTLALIDLRMHETLAGLDLLYRLTRVVKDTKFIILSMHGDKQYIRDAMNGGAMGYLLKDGGQAELLKCLLTVLKGETCFPKLPVVAAAGGKPLFTQKESEIIKLVLAEYTSAEIADRLSISPKTVGVHRKHICRKTNATTPLGWMKFLQEFNITL